MLLHDVIFDEQTLAEFCKDNGIVKLSIFGSILHERFGEKSDVDLLVEFDPERHVSLFDVGGMTADLEKLLGRAVDLRTVEDLSPYFRDDVLRQARLIYVA